MGDVIASPTPVLLPGADMDLAMAAAERLAELLEAELAALQGRDIERLEQMQASKTTQLQALAAWAAGAVGTPGWSEFQDRIAQCRQAHWRNETLMARQLDAIRGTLIALQAHDGAGGAVELYDRMGQMARRKGARGYSDA